MMEITKKSNTEFEEVQRHIITREALEQRKKEIEAELAEIESLLKL